MEITEFDVRFCYAPNLGAKVLIFFDICKFFCYLKGNIGINMNITRTITKNPPISSHFWIETISINILLTEGKEIATWSRSKPCTNYAADISL